MPFDLVQWSQRNGDFFFLLPNTSGQPSIQVLSFTLVFDNAHESLSIHNVNNRIIINLMVHFHIITTQAKAKKLKEVNKHKANSDV